MKVKIFVCYILLKKLEFEKLFNLFWVLKFYIEVN